jgi:Type I restriction-modification system methyltransferase subunit
MIQAQKDFIKIVRDLCRRHHQWEVFRDFCEMAALSLAQACTVFKDQEREERYLRIVGRYDKEEANKFGDLLGLVIMGLEDGLEHNDAGDFLGQLFMDMELSSHWHGQYFTPMSICRMLAEMNIDDQVIELCKTRGYVTLHEPASGSGAMVVAFAQAMRDRGLNPQQQLHVIAVDAEPTAAHMAYIQLSLLGIPAQVYYGNSLSMKMTERFDTFMHVTGLWNFKLARRNEEHPTSPDVMSPQTKPQPEPLPAASEPEQSVLPL